MLKLLKALPVAIALLAFLPAVSSACPYKQSCEECDQADANCSCEARSPAA